MALTEKQIEENQNQFKKLLLSVEREFIGNVYNQLEINNFFTSPASSIHHLDYDGGLCEHSLNVYRQLMYIYKVECKIKPVVATMVKEENIILSSLLHDVCKANLYHRVKKFRKDENNKWVEYYGYDIKHEESDYPVGHGEKSVITLLSWGLKLHPCEIAAIRWHMGKWDLSEAKDAVGGFNACCDKHPLLNMLMCADQLATRITENKNY